MNEEADQLESLIDSDQKERFLKLHPHKQNKNKKNKSFELFESLVSTNIPLNIFFDANNRDEQQFSVQQISQSPPFIQQSTPQSKRKRGRPKKTQKIQQQYQEVEDEYDQKPEPLNKNKKKKLKRVAKGDTRNLYSFFHRLVLLYIKQQQGSNRTEEIKNFQSNRELFFELLRNRQNKDTLKQMFDTRYLNRQVILRGRLTIEKKKFYLKRIEIFKHVFQNNQAYFQFFDD